MVILVTTTSSHQFTGYSNVTLMDSVIKQGEGTKYLCTLSVKTSASGHLWNFALYHDGLCVNRKTGSPYPNDYFICMDWTEMWGFLDHLHGCHIIIHGVTLHRYPGLYQEFWYIVWQCTVDRFLLLFEKNSNCWSDFGIVLFLGLGLNSWLGR